MTLLLVHAGATLALVGLIWTVQVVHYPLMRLVGSERWSSYHREHKHAITWVVAPLMLVELCTALWIAWAPPAGVSAGLARLGAVLALALWGITALVSVPLHERLTGAFDPRAHARLVGTNWLRTALWSARGILALLFVAWHAAALAA